MVVVTALRPAHGGVAIELDEGFSRFLGFVQVAGDRRLVDREQRAAVRLGLGRLLGALRGEDRCALVTLGPHLLLHRLLDRGRRVDRLDLDSVDADSPLAGRLVEHAAQLPVDLVARRQRLLERHAADDVAQRGGGHRGLRLGR